MSRIGKKPVDVPSGVKVAVNQRSINVEGPKGKLEWTHRPEVSVALSEDGKQVVVERSREDRFVRSLHGLTRSVVQNMVIGVSEGYTKHMEVYGVGYGVQVQGQNLSITCGRSHPVVLPIPSGVNVEVQTPQARGDNDPARFTVAGADKQMVGEFAARARKARLPEPYKGKGVRYAGERIRRKAGKQFAGAGAK